MSDATITAIATIGAALLGGVFSLVVCMVSSKSQHSKTMALIDYKITQLEKKVDKHNQVIDRVYKLEQKEAVHDKEIKVANHRIDDLKEFHK